MQNLHLIKKRFMNLAYLYEKFKGETLATYINNNNGLV